MSAGTLEMAVIDGILTGGVYALMAAGLTLIFGVLDMINIAQGIFVVLGSYASYVLERDAGIGLFLGLLITVPGMFLLGAFVEWAFIRRLGQHNRVTMSILVTYAVTIVIEGLLLLKFGSNYQSLSASYVTQSFHVLGHYLPEIYVYGFAWRSAAWCSSTSCCSGPGWEPACGQPWTTASRPSWWGWT